jgi:hypothetical protein
MSPSDKNFWKSLLFLAGLIPVFVLGGCGTQPPAESRDSEASVPSSADMVGTQMRAFRRADEQVERATQTRHDQLKELEQ